MALLTEQAFKDCWHKANLSPDHQKRWAEFESLMAALKFGPGLNKSKPHEEAMGHFFDDKLYVYKLLADLGVTSDAKRCVLKDMDFATSLVALFFDVPDYNDFLNRAPGSRFKNSLILNQVERAKQPPYCRTPDSNQNRPREHWREWDAINMRHTDHGYICDTFPDHWNLVVRPALAQLYKAGVICTTFHRRSLGLAISMEEPGREGKPDLHFDWRTTIDESFLPPGLTDPFKIEPLLFQAQEFARRHPGARFSVLKL